MADENKELEKEKQLPENRATSENFGFIKQEVSQPKWNHKKKKLFGQVITVVLLACMFGIIASVAYRASDYVLTQILEDNKRNEVDMDPAIPSDTRPGDGPGGTVEIDPAVLEQYANLMLGIQKVADELAASIVKITTISKEYDSIFGEETLISTEHTGILLADNEVEYLILVSYSDLYQNRVDSITVTFANGLDAEGTLLSREEELDLAVVRVSHKPYDAKQLEGIRVLSVGDSSALTPGAAVLAVGSPTGRHLSVNAGIITSMNEVCYITDTSVALMDTNMFGYDNGFGVLINTKGEMVGVLTRKFAGERKTMQAYSIKELNPVLLYMLNERNANEFGVLFRDLNKTELAELSVDNGIMITEVRQGSVAYQSGFRRGDIITKVEDIDIYYASQFFTVLNRYVKGQEIQVTFVRNGRTVSKPVDVEEKKNK